MQTDRNTLEMINSLKSLSKEIKSLFDDRLFADINLSYSELGILEIISDKQKTNMNTNISEIAKTLKITKSAASQLVSKLELKGYIYRKINDVDKKINNLYLTDYSLSLCMEKKMKCEQILEKIINEIGNENIAMLTELLGKVKNAINSIRKVENKVC